MASFDTRVPGFLGRVLDAGDAPVGTCFQVAPGVFVTAWHVLNDVEAGEPNDSVRLDPLAGGAPFDGRVARVDPLHDLAVVQAQQALPASIGGLAATDSVPLRTGIVITGVPEVADDPGHAYRHLDATGTWQGGTTRDDAVPLGRLESPAVVRGMSGAPVRRLTDDVVVGVVSAHYTSADDWLQHTVWVARTEHLEHLLAGVASVTVSGLLRWNGAAELVLAVTDEGVRLTGGGVNVTAAHRGVGMGLAAAVDEVRRARARLGGVRLVPEAERRPPAAVTGGLRRAGELLASSFLPSDVARALTEVMRQAEREHLPVRLGVEVRDEWARLPWEALPDPVSGRPLALHPLVTVYRRVEAEPVRAIPAPLRIVVAIASPEQGGGVLDYERELRNVLAAVRSARQGAASVRIVRFATTAAIRAALTQEPAHVLHLSGHGGPGQLNLEDEAGAVRTVTADEFVDKLATDMATDAMAFHTQIDEPRAQTRPSYELHPIVGFEQPTWTTGRIQDQHIIPIRTIRTKRSDGKTIDADERGDATVPRLSATPPDVDPGSAILRYAADNHGGLVHNRSVFDELEGILTANPVRYRAPVARIAVEVAEVLDSGEPLTVRAGLPDGEPFALEVAVADQRGGDLDVVRLSGTAQAQQADLTLSDPGVYQVTVRGAGRARTKVGAVTTAVLAWPPESAFDSDYLTRPVEALSPEPFS